MSEKIAAPKGMEDLLPPQSGRWQNLEATLRGIARVFGFGEMRFPAFEYTELFLRGIGDTTDVVQKEMFTFRDRGDRSVTLRPEGTASVVRAFIEHGLHVNAMPQKFYYIAPNFRAEKPQKGRLRQHHQFGVECFGSDRPAADAEVIALGYSVFEKTGIANHVKLKINSMGCPECRPKYNAALKAYLDGQSAALCETCRERLERNPARVLDCKNAPCKAIAANAPRFPDYLCSDCSEHFDGVKSCLDGLGIQYELDPFIVRGLDYYNRTVFEFVTDLIGAQSTVCGGGRYDGLVKTLGGPPVPALGFGMGIERLLLTLEAADRAPGTLPGCRLYVAPLGSEAGALAMKICAGLRRLDIAAEHDLCGRGLNAQMKYADKIGAEWVLVLGENEVSGNTGKLKNMREKTELQCNLDAGEIAEKLS